MDYEINFPNLGIFLEHVGKSINVFGFSIAYYGIVISIGMCLGLWAAMARAKATGQNPDDYFDLVLFGIMFGIVGARIYYVIFSFDMYKDDLLSIFNIREGGLAIYGGIIAGTITVYFVTKFKKMPFARACDTVAMSIPIGQILGRWGNFFNREAFGRYSDGLFAMQLPVTAVRGSEITEEMWEKAVTIDGVKYVQVHPTFLYESLWNVGVLIFLFIMRNRTHFEGELFLFYIIGYGTGRFWIESFRTDQLLVPGTSIPVSMVVSAAAVAVALILVIRGEREYRRAKAETAKISGEVSGR